MERDFKTLKTENGLEFVEKEFLQVCSKKGILGHQTCVGRPQLNGFAERMNKTLLERARCIMNQAKLERSFGSKCFLKCSAN